jgi:two-component system phosphate regulon sensor histidine kinase PhoR
MTDDVSIDVVQPEAERLGVTVGARVTAIRADGLVVGDSYRDPTVMDNHLLRPEVQDALVHGLGIANRHSNTVGFQMMYVAVPLRDGDELLGISRIAISLAQVEEQVSGLRNAAFGVSLPVILLAGILALLLAEGIARPIRTLTQLAERMAGGDMTGRIRVNTRDEIGRLARAYNDMAARLESRVDALAEQRNTLTSVMNLMADGVLITDDQQRVQLINPAGARILGVSQDEAVGERFVVVARDHQIVELWRRCRESGQEQSATVDMVGQQPYLQVVSTPLQDESCLLLLQDLTRIRRLETTRRDFISNISHELRTPLASLRALVETLQGGAMDDPPAAERFLNMMETEMDALTQMVEELLELSRIESGQVPLELTPTPLKTVVSKPAKRLRPQAKRAGLELEIVLPDQPPLVLADATRAGQVVTNLVHNAIKFTLPEGRVIVSAEQIGDEVVISVQDTGIGIPAGDLPRIFERFYKADPARSEGGTGLGLAIARHIVEAHNGRIWAKSVEGQGSTVSFSLQMAPEGDPN